MLKPSLSHQELLEKLTTRGLTLTETCDEQRALRYLKLDGYYRLSGYFWGFYDKNSAVQPLHSFETDTTWDEILHLYHADKDLRTLLTKALAEIELSIKAILVDLVCEKIKKNTGKDHPCWCWEKQHFTTKFINSGKWDILIQKLEKPISHADPASYLKNYKNDYPQRKPYVWMMVQVLSFGEITTIANNLIPEYQRPFSQQFNLNTHEMPAVLVSLSKLRNLCAHHNRIWNEKIREAPKIHKFDRLYNINRMLDTKHHAQSLAVMYFIVYHMLAQLHPSKSVEFQQDFGEWLHQLCDTEKRAKRFLPKMGFSPSILTEYFPAKP